MRRRPLPLLVLAVLLLTGCTATTDPHPTASASASSAPDAEAVVARFEVTYGPATVPVEVHPLVRTGDGLLLTLDIDVDGAPIPLPDYLLRDVLSSHAAPAQPELSGLRLLDLAGDRVATVAVDSSGRTALVEGAADGASDGKGTRRLQVAYADLGTDTVDLFVPQSGLVEDIPVIDGAPPAPPVDGDVALELPAAASSGVHPLSSFRIDASTQSRAQEDADSARITLGSDVLFATDSARLSSRAQSIIATAAAELELRKPGTVHVIGHTDDIDTAAHNLRLSQRRAQAVADALSPLVDATAYPLEVSGRGEVDPVADNGSVEGRAANRRVELTIDTAPQGTPEVAQTAVPDIDGASATGAEGVDWESSGRRYHIAAPRARVVEGHPVVTIELTATDDKVDDISGPAIFDGMFPRPPGLSSQRTMAGIAIMNGSIGTIAALHQGSEAEPATLLPLTDLATFSRMDGGDIRTSEIVFPRMPVGDTVTLRLLSLSDLMPAWQLTAIPVTPAGG